MTALSPGDRVAALTTLGLPAGATDEQITEAYRRLARAAHPDVTGRTDAAAGDRFAAISDAYHRLAAEAPVRPRPPSTPNTPNTPSTPSTRTRRRPPIVAGPVTITPFSTSTHRASGASHEQ